MKYQIHRYQRRVDRHLQHFDSYRNHLECDRDQHRLCLENQGNDRSCLECRRHRNHSASRQCSYRKHFRDHRLFFFYIY